MSMSSSSILFHQGLRCTKVPRKSPAATTSSATLPEPTLSSLSSDLTSSTTSLSTLDSTSYARSTETTQSSIATTSHFTTTSPSTTKPTEATETTSSSLSIVTLTSITSSTIISDSASESPPPSTDPNAQASSAKPTDTLTPTSSSSSAPLVIPVVHTSSTYSSLTAESTTAASTSVSTSTSEGNNTTTPSSQSENSNSDNSLGKLLGGVLGGVGFVALVLLAIFLFYRRKERKSRESRSFFGADDKLLRYGRYSADSATSLRRGYHSGVPSISDASTRSLYNHFPGTLTHPEHANRHSNPFSDTAEAPRGSTHSAPDFFLQDPFADPLHTDRYISRNRRSARLSHHTASSCLDPSQVGNENARRPCMRHTTSDPSLHSLGSTLILPGRSSSGSSLKRFSYPAHLTTDPDSMEPVTRTSTRSDPFDLEVPATAMHRHSSGVLGLPGVAL